VKLWESPFRSLRWAAGLAGALAGIVFLNSLANHFAYDDNFIILGNTAIQSLDGSLQALWEPYWPGLYGEGKGLWRPVVTGLFGLEWAIFNESPIGFHLVNVLLHAGVTALVVLLLGEIFPVAAAFVGGLLFAVHPVHVEAIANVVGVAELLSTLFFLLACLLIFRARDRMGPGRTSAVLLLYFLAFLTKESAITLPGVVLLLDCSREDIRARDLGSYLARRWPLYGGMVLAAGVVFLGRFLVLDSLVSPYAPLGASLLDEVPRIWTVAGTWPHVIRLLFFPLDLSADYGPAVIPLAFGWNSENITGLLLVLAILVLSFFAWRSGVLSREELSPRALGWGVVWFVITFSPTSNFFFLSGILLSERTLYLPSVGFVAAGAWVLVRLHGVRPRVASSILLVALFFMIGRSWTRTPTWKNNLEVFHSMTSEHPESGRSQWVLGDSYFAAGRGQEGLRAYGAALGILRGPYDLLVGASRNLLSAGYDRAAEVLLKQAWEQRPEFGVAAGLLATLYDRQGRYQEAEAGARYSLDRDPTNTVQYHVLARALQAQGRYTDAAEARKAVIRLGEGGHPQQWLWLAEIQLEMGDTTQARASLDSARLRIGSPDGLRQFDSIVAGMGLESR